MGVCPVPGKDKGRIERKTFSSLRGEKRSGDARLENYALCENKGKTLKTTKKTTGKEITARARPVVVSCISRMPTKAR
jgi:hypothetical protein